MKRTIYAAPLILVLAACESSVGNVATGAAAGAAVGAAVNDDNRSEGALYGAAIGGLAGEIVNDSTCIYTNTRTGERYRAACP